MVTMNLMDLMEKTELMGPMDLTVLGGFNAAHKTEAAQAAEDEGGWRLDLGWLGRAAGLREWVVGVWAVGMRAFEGR